MLQLIKSSFWSFLSVLVRALSSIAINKLFAVFYGPNGITLYAHFQNLVSIITTVPDGGTNIGIIKYLAGVSASATIYRQYFWAGAMLNLVGAIAALGLIFSFPVYYLDVFLQELHGGNIWLWAGLFGVGSLLLTQNLMLMAVVLARQELKWHVLSTSLMALGGVLAVYLTQGLLPIEQVLLLVLGAQAITFFLMLGVLFFKKLIPQFQQSSIPKAIYKDLWKYIVMALSAVVCLKLTNFYIRDYVISQFDLYQTGLWQAVVKVSENYSGVYTAVLGMIYFPRMAAIASEEDAMHKLVRNTFYIILPALIVALLLVYFLRDWVLLLLFNEDFLQANYLFDYQLLGDFFRLWSIILTNLMVVRAQVKLYIGWQLASALLYVLLVMLLIEPFGLEGVTMAHAIRYAATLAFAMLYYNRYIRL